MGDKIKTVFRLYRLYARMDLHWFLQDTGTAAIVIVSELTGTLASMAGVLLLAVRFGGAGGLSADEVLFMLGFFQMASGLCAMLFGGFNVMHISRRVGRGQIDHMLIQPLPLTAQLLTEGFLPVSGSSGFLAGLALTVIACVRLAVPVTALWLLQLLLYVLLHLLLTLAQSYLYGALAFYQPAACEELSTLILDLNGKLGKFPLMGIPKALLIFLCTALPTGLLAYVPALGLLKGLGYGPALALPVCVAAAFALSAAAMFRRGLRHYLQYSCARYKELGHRS